MLWSIRYRLLCGLLRLLVRCGVDERDLEAVVLLCQLKILRRQGGKRPRFTTADRAFLAAAARLLSRDRWSSFLVGPDTLLRWHRELLKKRPREEHALMRKGTRLALDREWIVGEQIGTGGFGRVHAVTSSRDEAVAKFVPKDRHDASPIDLIPEFIPIAEPLDDAIVAVLVLRHLLRRTGRSVLLEHWRGDPATLEAIVVGRRAHPSGN